MDMRALLIVATLLLVGLAGCAGKTAEPKAEPSSTVPTGSATFEGGQSDAVGSIEGLVVDEERNPLSAVTVALRELSLEVKSSEAGAFAFRDVPLGKHTIVAQRIGYESASRAATLSVDNETVKVDIILKPIVVVESYNETQIMDGMMVCGILLVPFCSMTDLSSDGGPNPLGDKFVFNWTYPDWKYPETEVLELVWTPTNAALNTHLEILYFTAPDDDTDVDSHTIASMDEATSPARIVVDAQQLAKAHEAYPESEFNYGVYPPLAELVVQQKFTLYRTWFWGTPAPEGWSALPPE